MEHTTYPERSDKDFVPEPVLHVLLQPEETRMDIPRSRGKTVARLMHHLGLKPGSAIVARNGVLLTPDVRLFGGQEILVRKVMSTG